MIVNIRTEENKGIRFYTIPDVPWQYPVITEKSSYECLLDDPGDIDADYVAFPWATIIDKRNYGFSLNMLPSIRVGKDVITVCQHIHYAKLAPILRQLGVTVCFSCHATEEDAGRFKSIGIELKPYPLYAVNATTPSVSKDYLYSFVGMGNNQHLLSDIRQRIFSMRHPDNACIKSRDSWHYRNRVYKEQVRGEIMTRCEEDVESFNRDEYRTVLARSRYSLCPSGTGPNTIRFWESLAAGSIPVILSDKMLLPEYDWEDCVIRIKEKDVGTLHAVLDSIPARKEEDMRARCLLAYRKFSGKNFASPILRYFEKDKASG